LPGWNDLLEEVRAAGSTYDVVRRRYLADLAKLTGRNVIVYYSGWLQKGELRRQGLGGFEVTDTDKNGFMAVIHKLDRAKGLDLLLHTPGGDTAATESLVDYLRSMFGKDIRAFVPQLALSAGTMIACSSKKVVMGKHSSLGPIDPQVGGVAAHGVIEEFGRAATEIAKNPVMANLWLPVLQKYTPTLIGECQKAIKWSEDMVKDWLKTGMFDGQADAVAKADKVVYELGSHALTLSHARHISMQRARDIGLDVDALEDNDDLQDAVLTVHHACIQTLTATPAFKIIENHDGVAFIQTVATAIVGTPLATPG
jgi:ClpP class serine protease